MPEAAASMDSLYKSTTTRREEANDMTGMKDLDRTTFLRLLTTQLQNQDPMNPMNNEEFVAQLATFAQLEQLMSMKDSMDAVVQGMASVNNVAMADLMGKDVVAVGSAVHYSGSGDKDIHYNASVPLEGAICNIYNENGKMIRTLEVGDVPAGEGSVVWNGRDTTGKRVDEGDYAFKFVARDASGEFLQVDGLVVGQVTEMDYSSGSPRPAVDGIPILLNDIIRMLVHKEEEE